MIDKEELDRVEQESEAEEVEERTSPRGGEIVVYEVIRKERELERSTSALA